MPPPPLSRGGNIFTASQSVSRSQTKTRNFSVGDEVGLSSEAVLNLSVTGLFHARGAVKPNFHGNSFLGTSS